MRRNLSGIVYASNQVPADYKCDCCGAHGVKLWREYSTFAENTDLLCAKHAEEKEKKSHDPDWKSPFVQGEGDQIGWHIPAVPVEGENTYWGYSSVPQDGVEWWKKLPIETLEKVEV